MRNAWVMLVAITVVFVSGCSSPCKVGRAVNTALAPETASSVWAPVLKSPNPTQEKVRSQMGAHNLTAFLLTLSANDADTLSKGYAWEYGAVRPDILARYLTDNSTLVASKHVSDIKWVKQPDGTLSGSFLVNTPYGLKATLLFAAYEKDGSVVITKLAIAKKESMAMADGFTVFKKQ